MAQSLRISALRRSTLRRPTLVIPVLEAAVSCLLLAGASGCISLSQTQSAQTLPPGTFQHGFGAEWYRAVTDADEIDLLFALPFYQLRAGLAKGIDFGARSNLTFTNFSVDLKLQPVDTEYFDLSIDPTLHYAWVYGFASLPVLVGINFNDSVQLTLSGRVSYALPALEDDTDHLEEILQTDEHVIVGGGLSVYLRVSRKFAIVPEAQIARGFGEGEPLILSFALGFTVGGQPNVEPDPEPEPIAPTEFGPVYVPDQQPPPGLRPEVPPGYSPAPPPPPSMPRP